MSLTREQVRHVARLARLHLSEEDEVRFTSAFSFIYSPRPGTLAADMGNQIPKWIYCKRF